MVRLRTTLKQYSHIFFDLDRTLWDFDRNSRETLTELDFRYNLNASIDNPDDFVNIYHEVNLQLWELYRRGEMTKNVLRVERFRLSLAKFGVRDDTLSANFGDDYLEISPLKTQLVPHTREILNYLRAKESVVCRRPRSMVALELIFL